MARDPNDPARLQYETELGPELGALFAELWQELTWLHLVWNEYQIIFATSQEQLDVANKAAGDFVYLIQKVMWESILLNLARLTDPPESPGKRRNLSVTALGDLVKPEVRAETEKLIAAVIGETAFARDWRNRYIAHKDLPLALSHAAATPLASASRRAVTEGLDSIGRLLNFVDRAYTDRITLFEGIEPLRGAKALMNVLERGLEAIEVKRTANRRKWGLE